MPTQIEGGSASASLLTQMLISFGNTLRDTRRNITLHLSIQSSWHSILTITPYDFISFLFWACLHTYNKMPKIYNWMKFYKLCIPVQQQFISTCKNLQTTSKLPLCTLLLLKIFSISVDNVFYFSLYKIYTSLLNLFLFPFLILLWIELFSKYYFQLFSVSI